MAVATSESGWVKSMKGELTCATCLKIYSNPVTLRCGHSFCSECVMESTSLSKASDLSCPICEEVVPIDAEKLTVNHNLQVLCSKYKEFCNGGDLQDYSNTGSTCSKTDKEGSEMQDETEVYVDIKQRLNLLNETIRSKYEFTTQFLDSLAKAEDTVTERANQLKHEFADVVESLKLDHLRKIKLKREKILKYFDRIKQMLDGVEALNLQIQGNHGSIYYREEDPNLMNLVEQIRLLKNECREYECFIGMQTGIEVQMHNHEKMKTDILELLRKCYLTQDIPPKVKRNNVLTGFLTMEGKKHTALSEDVPVFYLASYESNGTLNCNSFGMVFPFFILVSSSSSSSCLAINMSRGSSIIISQRVSKYTSSSADIISGVSATTVDGNIYLALQCDSGCVEAFAIELGHEDQTIEFPVVKKSASRLLGVADDVLCYMTSNTEVSFYSFSERRVVRVIQTPNGVDVAYLGLCDGELMLHTLDTDKRLSSWTLHHNMGQRHTAFEIDKDQEITALALDNNADVWMLTSKKLLRFSREGALRYAVEIAVPWLTTLASFGIDDGKLILIRYVDSKYMFLYIPLDEL